MIRMAGVKKIYRRGMLAMEALSGFDLHIRPGEFVSIMGPRARARAPS